MKNKWLERIGLICLLVTLLTLAITLTINARWLYQFDIGQLDLLDYTSLSEKELLHNFDQLMRYLNLPWIKTLKMTDFPVSSSGALHFYEVKKLFLLNYGLLLVTVVPSILYLTIESNLRGCSCARRLAADAAIAPTRSSKKV